MKATIRRAIKSIENSVLAEYLIGIKTIKKYEDEAFLYKEFQQKPSIIANYNKYLRKRELRFLIYGRAIPLFADTFLLGCFISSKDATALCGMILTEGYRHVATGFAEKSIENLANARELLQNNWDRHEEGNPERVLGYLSKEYEEYDREPEIEEDDESD